MVTLVAIHWLTPEGREKSMKAFKENSEKIKKAKGFLSREVLGSRNDPNKITTVTRFKTLEDYNNYFKIDPKRLNRGRTPEDPTELDVYDTIDF